MAIGPAGSLLGLKVRARVRVPIPCNFVVVDNRQLDLTNEIELDMQGIELLWPLSVLSTIHPVGGLKSVWLAFPYLLHDRLSFQTLKMDEKNELATVASQLGFGRNRNKNKNERRFPSLVSQVHRKTRTK